MFTGGEPLLQLDAPLIDAMHARGFTIAIETNGTLPAPAGIDWICVSPKAGTTLGHPTFFDLLLHPLGMGAQVVKTCASQQIG